MKNDGIRPAAVLYRAVFGLVLACLTTIGLWTAPANAAAPVVSAPAAAASPHPLLAHKRQHYKHLAMIERIATLARQTGDHALATQADQLRSLEQARYRRSLGKAFARLGFTRGG